jgi:rubrerythrin
MKFNKRILKESDTSAISGPSIGPEAGLSALLIESINGEWETVNLYNSIAMNAREAGFEDIAKVLDEINTEENKHIGQLQELLKTISPNAYAIKDGEEEAKEVIDDDDSWYDEKSIV